MSDTPACFAERLAALTQQLATLQVDAYLVPSSDTHLNEYVPAYQCRRAAISGFTGSAGDAVLEVRKSHLFVDSRYHLQAEQEVDSQLFAIHKLGQAGVLSLHEWLTEQEHQRGSLRLGFDPFTLSMDTHHTYQKALQAAGSALVPLEPNLVDSVWENRPPAPEQPQYALSEALTGRSVVEKLAAIREQMRQAQAGALILTKLDEIAWVTNLRGSDIAYNPVFEAYLLIERQQARCFARVLPCAEIRQALAACLTFHPYASYADVVRQLDNDLGELAVWLDPAGTTMGTRLLVPSTVRVYEKRNPVVLMKAVKNPVEITSMRAAHCHSAVAKIRSLARLERLLTGGQVVSERDYAEMLHEEYSSAEDFRELSFTTIAACGANGAVVHYSQASPEVLLQNGQLFLIDSGVQVGGGTTDDTRTISIGTPTARQRQLYTLVLRCHIQLARQKFPEGTPGSALDAITRSLLWNAGLDYGHGTGHGVGALLNVHEGPQRLATRGSDEPLQPGMVVSNEPGYYESGWGGIRLENLYVVTKDEDMPPHPSGKGWLRLDSLTLIPFDRHLIEWEQLAPAERSWLERYHQQVWETIAPLLDEADRAWLWNACAVPEKGIV